MKNITLYILKNTLRLVLLLLFVSIVTFALIESSPIDPITAYLGSADVVSSAQKEEITAYFGIDKPPLERYFSWISSLLVGDMGISIIYRAPVAEIIAQKFTASLTLMLSAFVLSGITGLATGMLMGQNKKADAILKPFCLVLSATPTFFIGIVFLIIFAVKLNWFPIGFAAPVGVLAHDVTFADRLLHLILPAIALSCASFPHTALHVREKTLAIMQTDYVLLAKSRGFSQMQICRKHILRNVLLPFVTLQFGSLSEIFGGSILAETVFSYPGLGSVIVEAGFAGDIPLLLGVTLFSCLFVFCGNFTANILYGFIDPQIRLGGRYEQTNN